MKKTKVIILSATLFTTSLACAQEHKKHGNESHKGHNHPAWHKDHKKEKISAPNGGRIIHEVEPHLEFFVTEGRKVQITLLDDKGKALAPGKQKISIIAGDRTNPTRLKFEIKDGVFLSDSTLPKGNDFPLVLTVKQGASAKPVRVRFNLDLEDCPTCDFKEYACSCAHGEEDKDDHKSHQGHKH